MSSRKQKKPDTGSKKSRLGTDPFTWIKDSREGAVTFSENIEEIPLDKIAVKENVRKIFDEEGISGLAESIKKATLLHPIIVIKAENDMYELLLGQRRYLASVKLSKDNPGQYLKIRSIVRDRKNYDEKEVVILQLIENIQREDLSFNDLRGGLLALKEKGFTHKQIAEQIKKSEGYVKNIFSTIKSIENNPAVDALMKSHVDVTFTDVQEIQTLPVEHQADMLKKKISGEIKSVKELRESVKEFKQAKGIPLKNSTPDKTRPPTPSEILYAQKKNDKKGIIDWKSDIHKKELVIFFEDTETQNFVHAGIRKFLKENKVPFTRGKL